MFIGFGQEINLSSSLSLLLQTQFLAQHRRLRPRYLRRQPPVQDQKKIALQPYENDEKVRIVR